MATSLQRPFFGVNIPYIDSFLNLSTTVSFFCLKVAVGSTVFLSSYVTVIGFETGKD